MEQNYHKRSLEQSDFAEQPTKKLLLTKEEKSNNLLDPTQYKKWSKEQVYSLLRSSEEDGGADLTVERAKPLYDAGFDGISLHHIVTNIQQKKDAENDLLKYFPSIRDTAKSIVNWVEALLETRLYHLWSIEHAKSQLCKAVIDGGAGIQFTEVENLTLPLQQFFENSELESRFNSWKETNKLTIADFIGEMATEISSPKMNSLLISEDDINLFLQENISKGSHVLSIPQIKESTSHIIDSFGKSFPLVGREAIQQDIYHTFAKYLECFDLSNGNLDKLKIVIPFIAAAPGIGKSKLLREMGIYLFENFGMIPLFITFGNGSTISSPENTKGNGITNALAFRIIFSIIRLFDHNQSFSDLKNRWYAYLNDKYVSLDVLLNGCRSFLHMKENDVFYIAIDEIHNIDTLSNEKTKNPLRNLLSIIGGCMQKKKVCPLLAGTYHTVIEQNLIGSTYTPKYIPIPAKVQPNDIARLLDDLSSTYPKLKGWRTNTTFRHYLRTLGGLMRGVEIFLEEFVGGKETDRGCWEITNTILKQKYMGQLDQITRTQLLKCILTRKLVSKEDKIGDLTFSQLENYGYIMLDPFHDRFIPTYPTILLQYLISFNLEYKEKFENLFLNHETKIYGLYWEDVIYDYLYLVLCLLPQSDIELQDVFPFAKMNGQTKKIRFHIPKTILQFVATTKIEEKQSKNLTLGSTTYNNVINETSIGLVVKNAPTAKAGDVLLLGFLKSFVFHIQCKWADVESTTLPYSSITKEIVKNNNLKLGKQTNNVTIVMTGKRTTSLPSSIPDNLIIIDKDNFCNYFGALSEQMRFLSCSQYLHINECNTTQLQSFKNVGPANAEKIVKARGSFGFVDDIDLQNKIGKGIFDTITNQYEIIY